MITKEIYDSAVARLRQGTKGLSDDDLRALTHVVATYQEQEEPAPKEGPEGPSMFGPVGEQHAEPLPREEPKTPMERALAPVLAKIPKPKVAFGEQTPEERKAESLQLRKDVEAQHDRSLPSSSQRTDLFRPPELMPQSTGIMDAFPSAFGGNTDHYIEPSFEQFQRDMAPSPRVAQEGENSEAFKQYKDARWKEVYEQAQREGRGVVRQEYVKTPEITRKDFVGPIAEKVVQRGILPGLAHAASFAHGADLAFAGIPSRITGTHEEGQHFREANPTSALAGTLAGSINPNSVGGIVATATKAAARQVLPKAALKFGATGLGGVLGAAGTGAVAGGSDVLASGVADYTLDDKGNIIPEEDRGEFDLPELVGRAGEAALYGAGIGGTLHAVGHIAGNAGRELRRETPELRAAERIGGRTSVTKGFDEGPHVRALEARAEELPGSPSGTALATQELGERVGTQGRTQTESMKKTIDRQVEDYYAATKNVRKPATELLDSVMKAYEQRTSGAGRAYMGKNLAPIEKAIASLADVEAVGDADAHTALRAAQAQSPDAYLIDGAEARRRGLPVQNAMHNYARRQGIGPVDAAQMHPYDFKFVVKPHEFTPAEMDDQIRVIDKDADVDAKAGRGGKIDPAYADMMKKARQVRDKFPEVGAAKGLSYVLDDGEMVHGWSALKHQHEDLIRANEEELQAAGLPESPELRPNLRTRKGVQAALERYGRRPEDMSPDELAGIHAIAENAGELSMLEGVRGLHGAKAMKKAAQLTGGTYVRGGVPSEALRASGAALRLRLDPVLSTLGLPAGERSFEPGYRPDTGRINNPFRLGGGLPGGAGFALTGRPKGRTEMTPEEVRRLERVLLFGGAIE